MKAIQSVLGARSGLALLMPAALSFFSGTKLSAQSGLTGCDVNGKVVAISAQLPTRSHIALAVTRKANNWVHTHACREVRGRLILLSTKDDTSLREGDIVVVPYRLEQTRAIVLKNESISAHCKRTYSDSTCAWRVARINSLALADTGKTLAQLQVYVPKSFALTTAHPSPVKAPQVAGPISGSPLKAPAASVVSNNWVSTFAIVRAVVLILAVIAVAAWLYLWTRRRIKFLRALEQQMEVDMRPSLPRDPQGSWVLDWWKGETTFIPNPDLSVQRFLEVRRALDQSVLSAHFRPLDLSVRADPIEGSALQTITLKPRTLSGWDPNLSPEERKQIGDSMDWFYASFDRQFRTKTSNAANGGPNSIQSRVDFQVEQKLLVIRVAPAPGSRRSYPNLLVDGGGVIDGDVQTVSDALQPHPFRYRGSRQENRDVVLRFDYQPVTSGVRI